MWWILHHYEDTGRDSLRPAANMLWYPLDSSRHHGRIMGGRGGARAPLVGLELTRGGAAR
jgi:hypothetical protein